MTNNEQIKVTAQANISDEKKKQNIWTIHNRHQLNINIVIVFNYFVSLAFSWIWIFELAYTCFRMSFKWKATNFVINDWKINIEDSQYVKAGFLDFKTFGREIIHDNYNRYDWAHAAELLFLLGALTCSSFGYWVLRRLALISTIVYINIYTCIRIDVSKEKKNWSSCLSVFKNGWTKTNWFVIFLWKGQTKKLVCSSPQKGRTVGFVFILFTSLHSEILCITFVCLPFRSYCSFIVYGCVRVHFEREFRLTSWDGFRYTAVL